MPASSADFARMALQPPPGEYNQAYMRTLVGSIERLLRTRVGRDEQIYWGASYVYVKGTDAAQAIAAATNTVVDFDTRVTSRDPLITFDGAASDFTVAPEADLIFVVNIRTSAVAGAVRLILRKNGATAMAASDQTLAAGGNNISATFPVHAAAGDAFDLVINAANAQTLDMTLSTCYVLRLSADPRLRE